MNLNTIARCALLAAVVALPLAARADTLIPSDPKGFFANPEFTKLHHRLRIVADAPPAYKAECGGCHLAYPPALLTAQDWQRVMTRLDQHYGDNAQLDAKTQAEISDFLTRNAATNTRMTGQGDPPWLTRTPWFERKHRKVPANLWSDARVVSASNCAACHGNAEQGIFSKRDLALPELQRGEHHRRHRHHDRD